MARPGSVQLIRAVSGVPAPMMRGAAAIALTLFDQDTPVGSMPSSRIRRGRQMDQVSPSAPVIADAAASAFAVIADPIKLPEFDRFALGTPEYPDRSTPSCCKSQASAKVQLMN